MSSSCSTDYSAYPYGAGVVTTTDASDGSPVVPDAITYTDYQSMIWRRLHTSGDERPRLYVWNPAAATDATYKKWVLVSDPYYLGRVEVAGDPTVTEIPNDKEWAIVKNTVSGALYIAANDGGAIKKITLT